METKVLSAIMKLQAAQIMLSNEGIHNILTTCLSEYGGIGLSAFANTDEERKKVLEIMNTYTFKGAELDTRHFNEGSPNFFTSYALHAFLSDI